MLLFYWQFCSDCKIQFLANFSVKIGAFLKFINFDIFFGGGAEFLNFDSPELFSVVIRDVLKNVGPDQFSLFDFYWIKSVPSLEMVSYNYLKFYFFFLSPLLFQEQEYFLDL